MEESSDLDTSEEELKKSLSLCAPGAVRSSKSLIEAVAGKPLSQEAIEDTASRLCDQRLTKECSDGLGAFFDRKPAPWTT